MPNPTVMPSWYAHLLKIAELPRLKSGCVITNGNVNCAAEKLLEQANAHMQKLGLLKAPLTIEEMTLARYIDSEGGSGTPSEKVAIGEAARNRAKIAGTTVDGLLRFRQPSGHPNRGHYGPIHATEAECLKRGLKKGCAPYGRWAATKRDPSPQALVIAQMIMRGETQNFAKGADDQMGPDAGVSLGFGMDWVKRKILAQAEKGSFWVGLLPGVNHRKTFLFRTVPGLKASSPEGQRLIAEALQWAYVKPDWDKISAETGEPARGLSPIKKLVLGLGGAASLAVVGAALVKHSRNQRQMMQLSRAAEKAELPAGKDFVLFALDSCPACEEFKPKLFEKVASDKVAVLDVEAPEVEALAWKYNVELLPTVVRASDGAVFPGISDPGDLLSGVALLNDNGPLLLEASNE